MFNNFIYLAEFVAKNEYNCNQEPYYVRCIKPNDAKSPILFDQKLVEHQVGLEDKSSVGKIETVI